MTAKAGDEAGNLEDDHKRGASSQNDQEGEFDSSIKLGEVKSEVKSDSDIKMAVNRDANDTVMSDERVTVSAAETTISDDISGKGRF